jgi:NAD(P)-dependent dehydrogenase (short-subunit alcohol dehydrogenase family)
LSKGLCIITGGSRGIGAATAVLAAGAGWDVAINYASNRDAAEAVAGAVRAAGRKAVTVAADVRHEAEVLRLFAEATDALGPPTALVNSAGITGRVGRTEDLSFETMHAVMDLNVIGTMLCCREAVRRMSRKFGGAGGTIVNLSSLAARIGSANEFTQYAASKGAIDSFTLGLAREVAMDGVRVNAVAPGMIETDIHALAGDPGRAERAVPNIPIRRTGSAGEVAEAILWLLDERSSYCVGTVIEVGGGR